MTFWPAWSDLSLRRKGLVVVAIPLVAVSLWFGVLIMAAQRGREAQAWRAHTLEVTSEIDQSAQRLVQAQSAMRGYLIIRQADWLMPFTAARTDFGARIDHLQTLVGDNPAQAATAARFRGEVAEWFADAQAVIDAPPSGMRAQLARCEAQMQVLRRTMTEMRQRENGLLAARTEAVARSTRLFAGAALFSLAVGIFGALAASWVYSNGVVRRIETLERNAGRLLTDEPFEPVRGNDEIGALASQFEQAAMLLRERTSELEAFTYSVSHDLRAPLRHVAGFGELLRQRAAGQLDAESQRYIATIGASAERMGQLIDDLLVLSRVGRAEVQHTRVSLPQLLEPVIGEQRAAAPDRAIEFRVSELPEVMGDPSLLRLALTNLVSNSVKYTRPRSPAEIEIGSRDAGDGHVEIFVRDNGVGFDMRYVDRLFGVFQRLHRLEEFEGTGIGLAIVRRVVHRHGGRAWAEGEVGRGATFFMSLPRAESHTS